jgi:hypothetical protein
MTINTDGEIGIGIASPASKLDVAGTIVSSGLSVAGSRGGSRCGT